MIRVPLMKIRSKTLDFAMFLIIIALIGNTVTGLTWIVKLKQENPDFLTSGYYIITILLLSVPILVATFFIVMVVIAICILIIERRRLRNNRF